MHLQLVAGYALIFHVLFTPCISHCLITNNLSSASLEEDEGIFLVFSVADAAINNRKKHRQCASMYGSQDQDAERR